MKSKVFLRLPQSLDKVGWENSRRERWQKRFGRKIRPLPNVRRDRELVNLPHPKILAPQKLTPFSGWSWIWRLFLDLSWNWEYQLTSRIMAEEKWCYPNALRLAGGNNFHNTPSSAFKAGGDLSKEVEKWEMLPKQADTAPPLISSPTACTSDIFAMLSLTSSWRPYGPHSLIRPGILWVLRASFGPFGPGQICFVFRRKKLDFFGKLWDFPRKDFRVPKVFSRKDP